MITPAPSKGMSDKPTFGSQLFGAVSEVISNPSARSGPVLSIIYILAAGLAVGLVLVIIDVYYPFLPINPISGPSAAARKGQTFWTGLTADAQNLVVPATSSPTQTAADYTVTAQIILQDSRVPSTQTGHQFRHILHRGTNVCGLTVTNPGPSGHNNIQLSDIPNAPVTYQETGLPDFMNPGLFLDPRTNDLHVFVHTQRRDGSGQLITLLESTTVADLPLNTPISIGVVLNGQTLEIYTNCRLYSTTLLRGQPFLPSPSTNAGWYGRACAFPFTGGIQNLTLWPAALNSGDYLQVCRSADFSKMALSPVCATASANGGTCPTIGSSR